MNFFITGCAGFIGSHLCRRLLKEGHTVYGIDDLSVGFMSNMEDFFNDDNFEFAKYDISLLRAVNDLLTSIKVLSNSIIENQNETNIGHPLFIGVHSKGKWP